MPQIQINRETGEYVITGRLNPASVHPSSTGKSVLLLSGAETVVTGDARGSINLHVRDVAGLMPTPKRK